MLIHFLNSDALSVLKFTNSKTVSQDSKLVGQWDGGSVAVFNEHVGIDPTIKLRRQVMCSKIIIRMVDVCFKRAKC
jgi:hypothetical protein